jgi:hypothetical protein
MTERLETRRHFSATVTLADGVLYARAADGSGAVDLAVAYADAGRSKIRVTAGGSQIGLFKAARVARVILAGGAGNDRLRALSRWPRSTSRC